MNAIELFLKNKNYRHIIWDWNGTLLNDFSICNQILCTMLQDHGLPHMSKEDHRDLFQFPISEFYQKAGFDFETTPFQDLATQFFTRYRHRVLECHLFEGVIPFLDSTQKKGMSHSILSASLEQDLHDQVIHYGIRHHFDWVFGLNNHFAISKIERGKQLLEASQLETTSTLLIGDTDHDLEVGKTLGVDVLLVAEGHQSYSRLSCSHPHVIETRFME